MNETLKQMVAEIAKNPEDWTLRALTADALEDNHQYQEAEAMRYLAAEKKRPYGSDVNPTKRSWFKATEGSNLGDEASDLPEWLYAGLEGGKETANHKSYPSPEEAEWALLAAWKKAKTSPPAGEGQ